MSVATLNQTAQESNLHPWLTLVQTEATADLEERLYLDFIIWEGIFGEYSPPWQLDCANDEAIPFDVSFLTRAGRA